MKPSRAYQTRRELLRHAAALAGAALLPLPLAAQGANLSTAQLSPRMHAIFGPNGNVLAADSDDGRVPRLERGHRIPARARRADRREADEPRRLDAARRRDRRGNPQTAALIERLLGE
jgi:hypothetical protein